MLKAVLLAIGAVAMCHAQCFVAPKWSDREVVVTSGIVYGSAFNNYTRKVQTLTLDRYSPPASDKRTRRPAVVLVHGGSFKNGDSTSDQEPDLARALVRRGYAVVSINYRLTGELYGLESDQPSKDAQEDASAAVRFLRKMAADPSWRIDPSRIAMGGDSAGAIAALTAGYVHSASEGISGNPGYSSAINASIAISGMLADKSFCTFLNPPSGCQVNGKFDYTNDVDGSPGQPPLLQVHGTADKIVPYSEGLAVHTRAEAVGLKSIMITIPFAGHVPMYQLLTEKTYLTDFLTFLVSAMDLTRAQCPQ